MTQREITLWVDERWCKALEKHLLDGTVAEKLEEHIDELVNKRHLLPATQRDRIPYPMMFQYTDHDPLGRTKVLTSVFD